MLVPLIVACALFMEHVDATVITTSLPMIARDLGVAPIVLKLGLTSYLVSLAVFIPISGWLTDRIGGRIVFCSAIAMFMVSSMLCGMSRSFGFFVAARFLQGIGGAMMVPVGRIVIVRTVGRDELVTALNYLTIPALLGPLCGPPLGGFITTYWHWRWIFFINVPISILGIFLALRFMENVREEEVAPLDTSGFVLSATGLSVLMFGLSAITEDVVPRMLAAACIVFGAASPILFPSGPAQTEAVAGIRSVQDPDVLGWGRRRLAVSHWHRRDCASAAADVAIGIRADPNAVGDADLCFGHRGLVHQRHHQVAFAALRISQNAAGKCRIRLGDDRRDWTVYGKNGALADFRRAVDHRLLPLAAVYRPERDHLCGDTGLPGQRRHQHVRHRATALTGRGRNHGGIRLAGVELSSGPSQDRRQRFLAGLSCLGAHRHVVGLLDFEAVSPTRERRWPDAASPKAELETVGIGAE